MGHECRRSEQKSHSIIGESKENQVDNKLGQMPIQCDELIYLGHKVSTIGIEQDDAKMKAIMGTPEPSDKKGIQRLFGLISYVVKCL